VNSEGDAALARFEEDIRQAVLLILETAQGARDAAGLRRGCIGWCSSR
jgi:phage baseplate assembly protein W